ncbi:MAG: bifunctional homocysteine S-methyltransferase/methylenetetrahydrofolate reductase [Anaerolineales bacterium]|nr:bifunctional homocysteine S-methyltransferase/methylenetetrahydrofolate reductase [Anaerolineales bacterium]
MAKIPFRDRLAQPRPILADGAMGTMLHQMGVRMGSCFDALNTTDPGVVAKIHRQFIDAGADIIETNTFSANPFKLKEFNREDETIEINEAGVELARRVVEATFRDDLYIAGAVGPLGTYLAPLGRVTEAQAYHAFRKQIGALIHAGVDLLIFETFSDLKEIEVAIKVAHDINPKVPILASMTFTRDDRTLLGDAPAYVANEILRMGADIVGANCSSGPAQLKRIVHTFRQTIPEATLSVMPNAGWPEMIGGRLMYPATPDYFGDYALTFAASGAKVIGGCCGTTPDHIRAMRKALDEERERLPLIQMAVADEDVNGRNGDTAQPTELERKLTSGKFVVTVEMAPPRGSATEKVVAAAEMLRQAGVDMINVSDSPMARMRMSPWAVAHLIQGRVGLETVLHFPTRGRNLLRVQGDLLAAHALGVRNIFVVMGDPTHIGDYPDAFDTHDVVPSGLIQIVKQQLNLGLDQAGNTMNQPTSFFVGTALNLNRPDIENEVKLLHKKTEAGADFALSQPIYEAHLAERFIRIYQDTYSEPPIPILAGVLPIFNPRHAAFLHNEVPGVFIPEPIMQRVEQADDPTAEGVKVAQELLLELREVVHGAYLMPPFTKYHLAAEVVEALAQHSIG